MKLKTIFFFIGVLFFCRAASSEFNSIEDYLEFYSVMNSFFEDDSELLANGVSTPSSKAANEGKTSSKSLLEITEKLNAQIKHCEYLLTLEADKDKPNKAVLQKIEKIIQNAESIAANCGASALILQDTINNIKKTIATIRTHCA